MDWLSTNFLAISISEKHFHIIVKRQLVEDTASMYLKASVATQYSRIGGQRRHWADSVALIYSPVD